MLADEAALKSMFEFKGASGLLPCPLCSNVVLRSSGLHEFDGTLKPHTVTSLELLRAAHRRFCGGDHSKITFSKGCLDEEEF